MCEGSLSYEGMTCMYCGRRVTGNLKFRYYYLFLVHNSWDCCAVKVSPIYVGRLSKGSSKTSNKLMCSRHSYVKSNSIYYCFLVFNEGISFQALELLWAQWSHPAFCFGPFIEKTNSAPSYEGTTCMYCRRGVTGNLKFQYDYLFLVHNSWYCCAVKVSPSWVGYQRPIKKLLSKAIQYLHN